MRNRKFITVIVCALAFFIAIAVSQPVQAKTFASVTPTTGDLSPNQAEDIDIIVTPDDKEYTSNIVLIDASLNPKATYQLNKKYMRFTGKIVTSTLTWEDKSMNVYFYGDGKLLKSIKGISNENYNQEFALDISNVKELKIVASNDGSYANG